MDRPPDKACLVSVHELRNLLLQPSSEDLGRELDAAILEANWLEGIRHAGTLFLQLHNVASIDPRQLGMVGVESRVVLHYIQLNILPHCLVEAGTETVRIWRTGFVHASKDSLGFRGSEGSDQIVGANQMLGEKS